MDTWGDTIHWHTPEEKRRMKHRLNEDEYETAGSFGKIVWE